jgi:hypothetical protein
MKKTKHVFFSAPLLIAYLLFSHGSSAQSGTNSPAQTAFSLKQAQEYALKTNLNNANAEIDIKLARARKNEIQGIGYPQIAEILIKTSSKFQLLLYRVPYSEPPQELLFLFSSVPAIRPLRVYR